MFGSFAVFSSGHNGSGLLLTAYRLKFRAGFPIWGSALLAEI